MSFRFRLLAEDSNSHARAGLIQTPHGEVQTPVFAPVGTQATVKTLTPADLYGLDASLILSNTYHLYLRPGPELIADFGGLHNFMQWDRPILTDSGGFQVFSLEGLREIDEDGVTFRSHLDGSTHRFTPEKVIEIEEMLGADIIMAFDECPPPGDYEYNIKAMNRTHRWAERCQVAHQRSDQALYGIVQGGIFPDLRAQSAEFLTELSFSGYGIGGLSVGETKAQMHHMLEVMHPILPRHKPRYLMGVGSPEDLFECVSRGVDQFDCVLPTRVARNGAVYTHQGRMNLRNARFASDKNPIEPDCHCYTCRTFSLAYLRHLVIAKETLALRLATIHNLHFLLEIMRRIRQSIIDGTFVGYRDTFLANYRAVPESQRGKRRQT